MSEFPKTIAAIQKRDRSLWEIGDALLAECGQPSEDGVNDGSYAKIQAAAKEIEGFKIEGYSVSHLKNLRNVAHRFPGPSRRDGLSWSTHSEAGSPKMLEAITKAAGAKPITRDFARVLRIAIVERQQREYAIQYARDYEREHGRPLQDPPPKKNPSELPTPRNTGGLGLLADITRWITDLKSYERGISNVSEQVDKQLTKLEGEDIDYLVDIALSLSERARGLADTARKLRAGNAKRSHLSVVGE